MDWRFSTLRRTLLLLLLLSGVWANAQVTIVGWEMSGIVGALNFYGPSPYGANNVSPGVTTTGLFRGSGILTNSGSGASNAWGGINMNEASAAAAATANDFFVFTIVPSAGSTVTLTSIEPYNIRRSSTGPTTGQWQYQINSGSFINIGSPITWGGTTTAPGNNQSAINLSGITDLSGVQAPNTITIRLLMFGGSAATGTGYINNRATAGLDLDIRGTIVTASAPSVNTGSLAAIATTGANVNNNEVTNENNSSVTARGIVWGTTSNPTVPSPNSTTNGSGLGVYNSVISGLTANTDYFVRAYATNGIGTTYGSQLNLTTLPLAPTATAQTAVTPTSFQANWTAPTQGSAPATYTLEVSELSDFSSTFAVVSGLTGTNSVVAVNPTTTYYYRVRMENASGFGAYSNIIGPFTTPAPLGPVVITNPALDVTNNSAQLFGSIDPNGATVNAFFDYGTTLAYGTSVAASPSSVSGLGAQDVSVTITGLQPNTLYNFRARGNAGINGNNLTFVTLANTPGTITFGAPGATTVTIAAIGANGNPATTQYAITSTNFPGEFLQFNGSFGPTPFFQTNTDWANTVVNGLNSSTTYQFQAIARNSDNLQSAAGPLSSSTTATCPTPAFTVTGISNSAATLTLSNSTGSFQYVVNTSPAAPAGPGTAENGNTVTATGLTQTTNYYAHVRNVCGTNFSSWTTVPFLTLANPVGLAVYDFNTCPCPSATASSVAANVTASTFTRGTGIASAAGGGVFNSNGFSTGTTSFTTAANDGDFVTFNLQANPGYFITYTALAFKHQRSGTGPANVRVGYSTDGGTTYTFLVPDQNLPAATTEYSVIWNFPTPFSTSNNVIFRVWAWGASGATGTYRVEDFIVNGIVSSNCNAPLAQANNITLSNITNTSADISWTNNGTADTRFVFVGAVGGGEPTLANGIEYFASSTFGAGSDVGSWFCVYAGTGNSVAVSNLTANTNYRVFVSNANCTGVNIQYNNTPATDNPNTFTTTNIATATLNAGPISNFGSPCIGQEIERTVVISGVNLSGAPVTVTAPANCAVSLVSGESYSPSVVIPYTGGSFSEPVYVRFIGTVAGPYSNNLTVSGGGASNLFIALNGSPVNTPAVVSTGNVSFISTTGATIAGSFTLGCAPAFSQYGIEYSVTPAFLAGNGAIVQAPFTGNNFSVVVNNLAINTVYYYRAYGINANGTIYGTVGSFSTLSGALETIYNYGDNNLGAPFFVHPTLTASNLVRSSTGWTNSTPCGSGFSGFGLTSAQTTFNTATNPFVNVDIVPNVVGNQLQVERISVQLRSSTNGPNAAMLAYSIDGGTTWTNRGVSEIPGVGGCGAINPGATTWILPSPVVIGYPLVANSLKLRLYFYNTAGQTGGNTQILNWVVSGRILQSPDTYYSVASGNMDAAIWSPVTNGTGSAVNFAQDLNAVVMPGHVVTQNLANVSLNNLTVQNGGVLRANSTNAAAMRNISLFGNLVVNGVLGNGATFDAIGLNVEGPNCVISGNGSINLGRVRKQTAFNQTTNLTFQANTNIRFPGAALYNNAPLSFLNITIPAGRTVSVTGSGGNNGLVSIDGIGDNDADNIGGSITVNGTLNVTGGLSVASPNNTAPYLSTLTLGASGVVNTIEADLRVNATTQITLTAGSQFNVSGVLRHRQGNLVTNNAVSLGLGAALLHGNGTPGIAPDPGGFITGSIRNRVSGTTSASKYNYWSSPNSSSTLSVIMQNGLPFGSTNNTYQYNANNATDASVEGLRAGWQLMTSGTAMAPGRGYITTGAGLVNFNGTPNNGLINVPVAQGAFTSFNLVGNPYPGPLDASAFITANQSSNIFPALYFWDDDNSVGADYSSNDYIVSNAVGTVGTGGNGAAGAFTGRISTGQGFFVETRPGASSVEFNNTMRSAGQAAFFDAPQQFSRMWLHIGADNGQSNETLLAFGEVATDGYDDLYDAKKMAANERIALYTYANNHPMAIQAWSPITSSRVIPVGLNATLAGTYTFSIANLDQFDATVLIYLEDTENGTFHNLRASGYSFNLDGELENNNRFRLHFSAPITVSTEAVSCEGQDGQLNISAPQSCWNYTVTNADGLILSSGIATENTELVQLSAGIYTLNFYTADGYSVVKTAEVAGTTAVSLTAQAPAQTAVNQNTTFSAVSTGDAVVTWNFGDGSATLDGNAVNHVFEAPGVYTVVITASNGTCTTTQTAIVSVSDIATTTGAVVTEGLSLWPNPASDLVNINTGSLKNAVVEVCDAAGKVIVRENLMNQVNTLSTSALSNGIYLVNVVGENGRQTFRLSVAH